MPVRSGSHGDHRFPKSHRLRKRREFLEIQRVGRKIHLADFLVLAHPRAGSRRLGITVSAKVGNAVTRNRVKRLLREAWRRGRRQFPLGADVVVVAKRRAASVTQHEVRRQLMVAAQKLRQWTTNGPQQA